MRDPSLPALRSLLADAGYRVLFRANGWAECYVEREAERWEGRGRTEDEALHDVLARMLPSHLAQSLVQRQILASPVSVETASIALAKTHPSRDRPVALEDGGTDGPTPTAPLAADSSNAVVPPRANGAAATHEIAVAAAPHATSVDAPDITARLAPKPIASSPTVSEAPHSADCGARHGRPGQGGR